MQNQQALMRAQPNPAESGASLNCWSIHHRGPERGCVEDQPQQLALDKKPDYEVGLGALRLVLRTQSRSNNLGMLGRIARRIEWHSAPGTLIVFARQEFL